LNVFREKVHQKKDAARLQEDEKKTVDDTKSTSVSTGDTNASVKQTSKRIKGFDFAVVKLKREAINQSLTSYVIAHKPILDYSKVSY
jgi:hypothetical protein